MLEHVNPKAVGMGRLKLASLCRAVGIEAPGDSCELHYEPVTAQVVQEIRKDTGETVNRVEDRASAYRNAVPNSDAENPSFECERPSNASSPRKWATPTSSSVSSSSARSSGVG
jgi:hypothetical protein